MENIALENKELIPTLVRKKDESPEKFIKEVGSNSNDETIDAESTDKSKPKSHFSNRSKL